MQQLLKRLVFFGLPIAGGMLAYSYKRYQQGKTTQSLWAQMPQEPTSSEQSSWAKVPQEPTLSEFLADALARVAQATGRDGKGAATYPPSSQSASSGNTFSKIPFVEFSPVPQENSKAELGAEGKTCILGVMDHGITGKIFLSLQGEKLPGATYVLVDSHSQVKGAAEVLLNAGIPQQSVKAIKKELGCGISNVWENIRQLKEYLAEIDTLVLVTGLGNTKGNDIVMNIAKAAHEVGTNTAALVSLPFSFEGNYTRQRALESYNFLVQHTSLASTISLDPRLNVPEDKHTFITVFAKARREYSELIRFMATLPTNQ
ncbi:hypothetical protein LJC46_06030 [Desulfovibrio sp. OttesenSCG-928-G15]|nr:hypothetical protein [Desulfovibrio sp. OttesenSCG-928-G15]